MIISVGIDPGLASTGIAAVTLDERKMSLFFARVISTPPRTPDAERLLLIGQRVREELNRLPQKPGILAIEKLFFFRNVTTALPVAQARGVILAAIASVPEPKRPEKIIEYTPMQVKKLITCNGRADKKQMQETVKDLLELPVKIADDNANDAAALAICGLAFGWGGTPC